MSWSKINDLFSVGIINCLYSYNVKTREDNILFECEEGNDIYSVNWLNEQKIAFGDQNGLLSVIDLTKVDSATGNCKREAIGTRADFARISYCSRRNG